MTRLAMLALLLAGCGTTGQDVVTFPVHGAGTGELAFEKDGWSVTIERADVGFGPVWLCATSFADTDVCPSAAAEWLGTASIDATRSEPVMLADASAVTTTVRSAMLDYGRSWLLTEASTRANEGAPEGHSAVFVVRATSADRALEIHAAIDVDPSSAGESAVIGASAGMHTITGSEALIVRLDPATWWRRVDFDRVAASDEDGDGVVEIARGDRAYDALVIAMTAGTLPAFEWSQP